MRYSPETTASPGRRAVPEGSKTGAGDGNAAADEPVSCRAPEKVLNAMSDPHSRAILAVTAKDPVAVDEIVEHCSMSTATAYRKVNRLVEAGLLEETVCVRPEGTNFRKFALRIETVHVTLTEDGFPRLSCSLKPKNETGPPRPVSTEGEPTGDDNPSHGRS